MTVTQFRPPRDSKRRRKREPQNRKLDRILSDELQTTAEELEREAMKEPVEVPREDARKMLDRMLAAIHSDPELSAKAKETVFIEDEAGSPVQEAFTAAETPETEDMEELIRLGRALKASGKTLEDILEEAPGEACAPEAEVEAPKKKRRWTRPAKVLVGAAASFVVLITVSMSSNAMRMYWIEKFGWLFGNKPMTTVNNENHFDEDRNYTETEALNVIKDSLGIKPIYFAMKPDSMKFEQVYVDEEAEWAKMFYIYNDMSIVVLMDKSREDTSLAKVYDGEDLGGIKIEASGEDVFIHKIQRDNMSKAFYAETEYGDTFYSVIGDMEEEVFKDLMKHIEFW